MFMSFITLLINCGLKLLSEFGRETIRLNKQNTNLDPCGI